MKLLNDLFEALFEVWVVLIMGLLNLIQSLLNLIGIGEKRPHNK